MFFLKIVILVFVMSSDSYIRNTLRHRFLLTTHYIIDFLSVQNLLLSFLRGTYIVILVYTCRRKKRDYLKNEPGIYHNLGHWLDMVYLPPPGGIL